VVFKTLYPVSIRFCNLAAETALIPQLAENSVVVSRFRRLQAFNEKPTTWASSELSPHGSYPSHPAQIDEKPV